MIGACFQEKESVLALVRKGKLGQHRTENCVQKMSLRGKIKT